MIKESVPTQNQNAQESNKEEECQVDKAGQEQKPETKATLMGSISIQQV